MQGKDSKEAQEKGIASAKSQEECPTKNMPESVEKALEILSRREATKIKGACKILKEAPLTEKDQGQASKFIAEWIGNNLQPEEFLRIARQLLNLVFTFGKPDFSKFLVAPFIKILHDEKICENIECQRLLKSFFEKFISEKIDIEYTWQKFIGDGGLKISNNFICALLKQHARKGPLRERNKWESFQQAFCVPLFNITNTCLQECMITTRVGQTKGKTGQNFPSSVVVWNGNGVRARWSAPNNELKSLIHTVDPDLFCFLESKTDSDKLLALQGFEEWVNERGFCHLFCHWSAHESKTAHGCEGILIFSKVPCEIFYGMGEPEFDKQARIATVVFPAIFLVISYNPQGGFSEKSLEFRDQWEKAFTKFLGRLYERAEKEKKGVIWAGDFNVNPFFNDWSPRAFDQIRHKIPKGTKPAGCREKDQESFNEMTATIKGKNLADFFSRGQKKRTCFPNEFSLTRNFGQRIDHVVAQEKFLNGQGPLQIKFFDVLQDFGGGRKFCSDHCPLIFTLEQTCDVFVREN